LIEVDGAPGVRAVDVPHHDDILNEDTYSGHKYDYLFLADGDWTTVTGDVSDVGRGLSTTTRSGPPSPADGPLLPPIMICRS
jgi:hypothetical protein